MSAKNSRELRRRRRHRRVRGRVEGTAERPRLCVRRSLAHMYVQIIDDAAGCTLASCSTLTPDVRQQGGYGGNVKAAQLVGAKIAELALARGVKLVRFDRGGYRYHGRVKAVAEAARKAGLEF